MSTRDSSPVPATGAPNGDDQAGDLASQAAYLDDLEWEVLRWMAQQLNAGTSLIPYEAVEAYFERRGASERLPQAAAMLAWLKTYKVVTYPPMPRQLEDALARGRPVNQRGTPECAAYVGWLQSERGFWQVEPKAIALIRWKDGAREGGKPPSPGPNPTRGGKGKQINLRMIAAMQKDPIASLKRSTRQWAELLGCSPSTVQETDTWRLLQEQREAAKLERQMKDRERRTGK
jgi:hypothetical protein